MGTKQAKVRQIKVVVDTNVLVSGFLWQGNAKEIFILAKRGIITLCVTEEIIDEFQRVFEYPKFAERLIMALLLESVQRFRLRADFLMFGF